jgi:hypothetical protein
LRTEKDNLLSCGSPQNACLLIVERKVASSSLKHEGFIAVQHL